jgi:hypothetical protein
MGIGVDPYMTDVTVTVDIQEYTLLVLDTTHWAGLWRQKRDTHIANAYKGCKKDDYYFLHNIYSSGGARSNKQELCLLLLRLEIRTLYFMYGHFACW